MTYVAAWVAIGATVATVVLIPGSGAGEDPAPLPPVREPELTGAVRAGGCRLTKTTEVAAAGVLPAQPGIYDRAPIEEALAAARRGGVIVVRYRRGLDEELRDRLEAMQQGVPKGTILAPAPAGASGDVAVSAYRRLLACPSLTSSSLDALRLFQGRYLGSGPDP
jgi:hypothetical protein